MIKLWVDKETGKYTNIEPEDEKLSDWVKVFYNGYVTSAFDFVNFMKTGGVIPIIIYDNEAQAPCHIAWISDYGDGHACLHHCTLGQFKRGSGKAILKYYETFKDPATGASAFETMIGITPENNEAAVRVGQRRFGQLAQGVKGRHGRAQRGVGFPQPSAGRPLFVAVR